MLSVQLDDYCTQSIRFDVFDKTSAAYINTNKPITCDLIFESTFENNASLLVRFDKYTYNCSAILDEDTSLLCNGIRDDVGQTKVLPTDGGNVSSNYKLEMK